MITEIIKADGSMVVAGEIIAKIDTEAKPALQRLPPLRQRLPLQPRRCGSRRRRCAAIATGRQGVVRRRDAGRRQDAG